MPPVVPSTDSAHPHPESEPLNVDPDAPLSPSNGDDMGYDEQFVKPEGRPGDVPALWAACASAAVFVVATWTIVLTNNPTSLGLFFFHPILQSLSIAMFTYG
ncbi:hypothetical protein GSI_13599 [Ganoderma sinense ZZ0214-1]|uniref:Uncharacterized protein n=1 Tax=Ganoderma sinense ZZ0214-1 TaxID=1077348 RepID=A0A2G8RR85_9APHY|nr:hypothetical protein GSI_13599 [Ganoderma sinense ZZ0214-1]